MGCCFKESAIVILQSENILSEITPGCEHLTHPHKFFVVLTIPLLSTYIKHLMHQTKPEGKFS